MKKNILLSPLTSPRLRFAAAGLLILIGLILCKASIVAGIKHPPFVSWIPDQRISSANTYFDPEYFRVLSYDPGGFNFMKTSSTPSFYSGSNVSINPCTSNDSGCAQDGTGYKISFTAMPANDGATTISIRAVEPGTGGLTGYTSFTLQRDTFGDMNPPVIGAMPNYALPIDPTNNNQATYKTMFVIGDLDESGMEDIDSIDSSNFSFTSSYTTLLPTNKIIVALMPPDPDYALEEGHRTFSLTATTAQGITNTATTVTVTLHDPDMPRANTTSTSFVLQALPSSNTPPTITNVPSPTYSSFALAGMPRFIHPTTTAPTKRPRCFRHHQCGPEPMVRLLAPAGDDLPHNREAFERSFMVGKGNSRAAAGRNIPRTFLTRQAIA